MALIDRRFRLAQILEEVARGDISAEDALRETESWKDIPWSRKLWDAAWHNLYHFQSDADIRQKDAEYADAQRDHLLYLAGLLRRPGIPDDEDLPGSGYTIPIGKPKHVLGGIIIVLFVLLIYWLILKRQGGLG